MIPSFPHSSANQPAPNRRIPSRLIPQARQTPEAAPQRRDPAPSRLAYRWERLWLTPLYRRMMRVGLPVLLVAGIAGLWLSDETRRASMMGALNGVVEKIQTRDEFMVKTMRIEGASPALDKALRMMLPVELPASSFDIDLTALRRDILSLDAVADVDLRVRPGGELAAHVTERRPVMLWRHARGVEMLDATGHRVASVTAREVRPDLPMVAGEGAEAAAAEALALIDAAGPILPRLRGLQRVGERRWDVILDNGQRLKLPADNAVPALERAIAIDKAERMLARDIAVIDLRNAARPVVQMRLAAQNTIRVARGEPMLGPDGLPLELNKKQ